MHHWRTTAALLLGHRRAAAVLVLAHMLPELFERMSDGGARQPALDVIGKRFVSGMHVGEFGAAQRFAVAPGNPDPVQYVYETDHIAIGHIGVPVLPSVGRADIFSVLFDV